jgi:DNA-binding response OmpR family regulator
MLRKKVEPAPRNPRHILTVHGSGYRLVRTEDDALPA